MKVYLELFWIFFKIGAFTLGGGYAMVPLIQAEIVVKKSGLKKRNLSNFWLLHNLHQERWQ